MYIGGILIENREQEIKWKFVSSKAKRKESKPSHSDQQSVTADQSLQLSPQVTEKGERLNLNSMKRQQESVVSRNNNKKQNLKVITDMMAYFHKNQKGKCYEKHSQL